MLQRTSDLNLDKMRMHSYGKFSPNLIIGALLVFSVLVLYNYWSISAVNHDLTLKIHSLEQQIISLSKTNDALQSNLEKVEEIREKVEVNLQKELISEQQAKEDVSQKEVTIKSLQNDLENAKQEASNCKEENNAASSKFEKKEQEVSNLKEQVTSLQAQMVEKDNKIGRIEKELEEIKKQQAKAASSSTAKSAKLNENAPVDKPGTLDEQPVLLLDPAEKEMKPAESVASPPGVSLDKQPNKQNDQGGSGEVGVGVLPVPGQPPQQAAQQQGNLDAQEDDGDRPLKDDLIQQDDQSPDGDLPHKGQKDNAGVGPAPLIVKEQGNQRNNAGGLSGQQEEREAAHLRVPPDFDTNNNL